MKTGWALTFCALLTSLQGCGTAQARPVPFEHRILLEASSEKTEEGLREILGDTPILSDRDGLLQTDWIEGWGDRPFGLLQRNWRRRVRLAIRREPAGSGMAVSVRSRIEEKPPGGSMSLRWRRAPSDGTVEQEFLEMLKTKMTSGAP